MEPLTTAELRALHALARYEYATDAAKAAGISPQTLRNQAGMAYKKLGVNGRTEAFRKIGWLRPPRFMPSAEDPDPFKVEDDEADIDDNVRLINDAMSPDFAEPHSRRARRSARLLGTPRY